MHRYAALAPTSATRAGLPRRTAVTQAVAALGAGCALGWAPTCSEAQTVPERMAPGAATSVSAAAAPASAPVKLDAVIVTSQKRAEALQDVPMSVNVISAKNLQNMGAQNFTDLIATVPSLSSFQTGPGRSQLIIRGVTTGGVNEDDPQTQETVGLYVDETPISVNGFNPEYGLFDLERVEVLRGPQGTLYGGGAMSGAVKLVTRKPDLTHFGGSIELDASGIRHGSNGDDARAVLNVPLIDGKAAIRASVFHDDFGGYIDNRTTGAKDVDHSKSDGGRLALRLAPMDALTVDLSYFGQANVYGARPIDEGGLARSYRSPEGSTSQYQLLNATIDADLGFADLVSATSWLKFDITNRRQLDKTLDAFFSKTLIGALADQTHMKDFTQEVRLDSKDDGGHFKWLAGVYFNHRQRDYLNDFPVPGFDALIGVKESDFGAPADNPFYGYDNVDVTQSAAFGEITYTIGQFGFTAGLREFHWDEDFFLYSSGLLNGGITTSGQRETTKNGSTPKFNATYKFDADHLVYVQAAKGFRFGGINQIVPLNLCGAELAANNIATPAAAYNPDSLWNYELGTKSTFLDGALTVNASVYYIKWKDVQVSRSLNCGFSFRENAAGLTSKGVELETAIRPITGLTLTLGGSYVNATLDANVPDLSAKSGDPSPYVPKRSVSATSEYRFPLAPTLDGYVWAAYQFVDKRATDFDAALARYRAMGAYSVVNARVGVQRGPVDVSLYAKNLLDSGGVLRALASTPYDAEGAYRITPRTVGVTARVVF